ncbi:MAG: gamma-glutamyltransferase [Planctomycetota bacterium]|nr:gamma-glutamyltransferase [Planctomycetota bacterium]
MRSSLCITAMLSLVLLQRSMYAEEISWKASGTGGAIAAGGSGAVHSGMRLLRNGGNAADAAAATLLALAITDYGFFAIGGEVPLLIFDARTEKVTVLSGLGRAPRSPEAIAWFYKNGIPANGSMKSAPVPGAIDLCVTLLRLFGTKSFEETVSPTLELLDNGNQDWHPRLAITLRKLIEAERQHSGTREEKLTAARDRFYIGDVADELVAWYKQTGSFLRKNDLAAHRTSVEQPVSAQYRGYTVYKCGPWTQGPVLCQTLRLLEGFDLQSMKPFSPDYIHVITESLKLALADRDEYYGDPAFVQVPLDALLSDSYTQLRRKLIDPAVASFERRPGDPSTSQALKTSRVHQDSTARIKVQDTTTCVVADRWGNVVAATPSCNLVGNTPGPSGVTQGNRLRSLNTTQGHPNRIQPGKRPRITLTPTLVTKNNKPVVAISVAGGDLQDQTTLNVLLNHIEFGMLPKDAVTTSRFYTSHHQNSFDPNPNRNEAFVKAGSLHINSDISTDTQSALIDRGHLLQTTSRPIAHPVMIYIDHEKGLIHAAGDPRTQRHADAIP